MGEHFVNLFSKGMPQNARKCPIYNQGQVIKQSGPLYFVSATKTFAVMSALHVMLTFLNAMHQSCSDRALSYVFYPKLTDDTKCCNDTRISMKLFSHSQSLYFFPKYRSILYDSCKGICVCFPNTPR